MPTGSWAPQQDFHFGVQYNQAGVSGVYGYNDFIYTYLSDGKQYGYGNVRQTFSYAATDPQHRRVHRRQHPARQSRDVEPGRAGRSQQGVSPPQERARRQREADRQDISACGFLHVEQRVTPPGCELEAHRRRQDDRQVALGPLPSASHHRRVRQHHRSQHQAVLSGDLQLRDRPGRGSVPDEQQPRI